MKDAAEYAACSLRLHVGAHPNVVALREVIHAKNDGSVFIASAAVAFRAFGNDVTTCYEFFYLSFWSSSSHLSSPLFLSDVYAL